jgi:hypothetical protein
MVRTFLELRLHPYEFSVDPVADQPTEKVVLIEVLRSGLFLPRVLAQEESRQFLIEHRLVIAMDSSIGDKRRLYETLLAFPPFYT